MRPIKFKKAKNILKGYDNIGDLPVYIGYNQIISKWKMNFWERIKVLFTGNIWFLLLSAKRTHAPIKLSTIFPFIKSIRQAKR